MPALFEMTVKPVTPELRIAPISPSGIPQRPNPPDITVMPSRSRPASAAWASGQTLSIVYSWARAADHIAAVNFGHLTAAGLPTHRAGVESQHRRRRSH